MWLNQPIRTSGRSSRTMAGTSCIPDMRVFSAALATETNTFAAIPTGLRAFRERGYFPAGTHPDRMSFFAAPLWAARLRGRALGWDVVEGMVAGAQPGGITTRAAYEALRDELLADLRAALPVDMVLLGLHGAMVADGYDDCEGDISRAGPQHRRRAASWSAPSSTRTIT